MKKSGHFSVKEKCSDSFDSVPVTGLEPVRYCYHGILSPGRLPIPPHRHGNASNYILNTAKCQYKDSDKSMDGKQISLLRPCSCRKHDLPFYKITRLFWA